MTLRILNHNFREMYHWLKFPSNDSYPLTANFSETHVYDSRYFLGKLWSKFHTHDKLKKAIQYTNTLFQQEIVKIRQPLKQYQDYLKKKGSGYDVNEEDLFQARKLITEWNAATKPFLKIFSNPAIKQSFVQRTGIRPYFFPTYTDDLIICQTTIFFSTYTDDLISCQNTIDLEGLTKGPLPVQVLKKIIKNIPLNAIDQKDLDRWINKIEKNNIEAQPIHKALKHLCKLYAKKNETPKTIDETLIRLELFLEDKGCTAFKKNDPKHIKWRQNLDKDKTISCNGATIILGNEIYPMAFGSDQTRAYTIKGQPDQIALIAHNRIALPLRYKRMQVHKHPDIAPALFDDISSDGRIALVERLKPLNTLHWVCVNGTLNEEENSIVNSLTAFIQKMISQNYTPLRFSSNSLMFDKQWHLKFVKPMARGEFDFIAIEDFISDCATGNAIVFRELMTKSGLNNHAIAKYYKDVVLNTLRGETIAADDLAGIYRISDSKVVDRALVIIEQVKEQKKQFLLKLRKSAPGKELSQIESLANKILYNNYLQSNIFSKFCPILGT